MRIIGGRNRGRRLEVPAGPDLRPTSDRAREAVFNILEHGSPAVDLAGAVVVDLFAGGGGLGLEALSRGASQAIFIDLSTEALTAIRRNAAAMGVVKEAVMLKLDASRLPPPARITNAPCDLAFLDPPYNSGLVMPALLGLTRNGWLKPGAICVVEMAAKEPFEPPRCFIMLEERTYGAARVLFLRHDG